MRILLVNNYYPEHVGGIETVAANLSAGYRERGHQVRWVAGDIGSRPHTGVDDDVPVRVWNGIERLGFPYPAPSIVAAAAMRRHVRWCDVVHMHDSLYALNLATFIASRREHRPVLLTQHVAEVPYRNPLLRGLQSAAYSTIGRQVLRRAEQVVFVSDEVRRWFEARVRFRKPPLLIENGIDAATFEPLAPDRRRAARSAMGANGSRPLVLFVGRFVEKKGIRVLRPLIESTPGCEWILVGRAGDVDPSGWRLANLRVVSPVPPPELRDYYAAADLLVLPSVGEGFPVVAQEAMACGTPALLTEATAAGLPGLERMVFTSPPDRDHLARALDRALAAVAADPGLRERVAVEARGRWGTGVMVGRYLEQLERLSR